MRGSPASPKPPDLQIGSKKSAFTDSKSTIKETTLPVKKVEQSPTPQRIPEPIITEKKSPIHTEWRKTEVIPQSSIDWRKTDSIPGSSGTEKMPESPQKPTISPSLGKRNPLDTPFKFPNQSKMILRSADREFKEIRSMVLTLDHASGQKLLRILDVLEKKVEQGNQEIENLQSELEILKQKLRAEK
jgi:hypothetical protein